MMLVLKIRNLVSDGVRKNKFDFNLKDFFFLIKIMSKNFITLRSLKSSSSSWN